ncbi:GreA/GreB family elongation factor [Chloroflexota bacterium]
MNSGSQNPNLGEAATRFLASLPLGEKEMSQQEVYRFVRWYGRERALAKLAAPEVANYADHLSLSDTDYIKKLGLIQAFLVYAKKKGWSSSNLAPHLKAKKVKAGLQFSFRRGSPKAIPLTQQGYAALKTELAALKSKRSESIDEVHRAAADKDFRENAPLEAAREQYSHLEGQIKGLEETLKSAVTLDGKQKVALKVSVGDSITLRDLASGEELHYVMVNSKEVDPTRGKISSASPMGKAIIGRSQGEITEVIAPAGKLRYQIEQIWH